MPRRDVITQSTQVCFYPVVNVSQRGVCGSARVEGHSVIRLMSVQYLVVHLFVPVSLK